MSAAVLVRRQPSLLTTAGVEHSIRGALAELRDVLPEACVCWLVLEVRRRSDPRSEVYERRQR